MEDTQSENPVSPSLNPEPVTPHTEAVSTVTVPSQTTANSPKSNNLIKQLFPFIAVGVLSIIAFIIGYYFLVFESPAKVASRAEDINTSFVKYSRLVKRTFQHLEEESGSSADGLERYAAQGEDLVSELRDTRIDLDNALKETKVNKLNKYLLAVNDYLKNADKLSIIQDENIKLSNGMIKPTRMYEELTVELSGASNYLLSDTKKYAELTQGGIAELKKIKQLFQLIEVGDPFDEYNKYTVSGLDIELKYFESLLSAVENRDSSALATAGKVFAEEMQKNGSDASRVSDKIKNEIKELGQKLEEQKEDVEAEYANLKNEYKF